MKSKILKLLMVALLLYIITLPFGGLVTILFGYILTAFSVVLPIELLLCSKGSLNRNQMIFISVLLFITIINSLGSVFQSNTHDWEGTIKAWISFASVMISISVRDIKCTQRDWNFYFNVNRLSSLAFICYTILPFSFRYTSVNEYGNLQFTMSMGNPNATATRVMFCICLLLIQLRVLKGIREKVFNWILVAGLLYTLVMLQCRTAVLCCMVACIFVFIKIRISERVMRWVWIVPVLFIGVQLILERFPVFYFLGKSFFSGRETLYREYITQIVNSPEQFVLGSFIDNRLGNMHNIFFAILFNFGIIGVAFYYWFWYIESKYIAANKNPLSNLVAIAIMMFIVQGSSEAATLSGALTYGFMLVLLCRMGKDMPTDMEQNDHNISCQIPITSKE